MKTLQAQNQKFLKAAAAFVLLFAVSLFTNSINAQTETIEVKGVVTSEVGPLDGVNIYLKNSSVGTVSKSNGSFAFREPLKIGDIVVFSYLGYVKKSVVVTKNSNNLEVFMEEAPIDVLSAPNSNVLYKSKRPKGRQ
ncbi:carboxypeptidase-like regulatory domain-containing protein [Winogradskyella litorisediminis]|uniref:Carboxypeptidase-like regulatory domain-containing protein n=1 Tax=Winogradskyella litorisediminis TaxID=1156618 RepID=A0ABW3N6Q5_9FLAO